MARTKGSKNKTTKFRDEILNQGVNPVAELIALLHHAKSTGDLTNWRYCVNMMLRYTFSVPIATPDNDNGDETNTAFFNYIEEVVNSRDDGCDDN